MKFIDVMDDKSNWILINTDQITKVTCDVVVRAVPEALEAGSLLDPTIPAISPARDVIMVTIRLYTANGEGWYGFDSTSEADIWAETYLGIDDITLRSHADR